jgi:hypothetical protein
VSDDPSRCLVCGEPPAEVFCSLPPGDQVQGQANGQTVWYTLCTTCLALPDACERVDMALKRQQEGGTHDP